MSKKNLFLILLTLALAGVYVVYFTDWFRPAGVQISHTFRPIRQATSNPQTRAVMNASAPVIFFFQRALSLTQIKVIAVAELETNKFALPVWHIVSDSNSPPVKSLIYGNYLRGMRAANKGQVCQPLVPGMTYRLFLEAGELKGQHDFQAKANPGPVPK